MIPIFAMPLSVSPDRADTCDVTGPDVRVRSVEELLGAGALANPYPAYRRLRDAGAVHRAGPGQWAVPRHADVSALLRDSRLGSEFPAAVHRAKLGDGPAAEFFARILIDRDPPAHTRLRKLISPVFSRPVIQRLADHIGHLVDELLEPALERHSLDAVGELGYPLPVTVICELMGIPPEDRELVRPRMVELAVAFGALSLTGPQQRAADEAVEWLRAYVRPLLAPRRERTPADQPLTGLLASGGQDLEDEVVDNAVFLFFAGFETTMNLIANGLAALVGNPDQLALLRSRPDLIPTAVEELLRYDAPIQLSMRLVREPVEIDGRTLRAGRVAVLLLGAANHDERVFNRPDQLDVSRQPVPHVSFGGGHHYCIGAVLARIEAAVVLERLLGRTSCVDWAAEPVRRPHVSIRAYATVPLRLTPA